MQPSFYSIGVVVLALLASASLGDSKQLVNFDNDVMPVFTQAGCNSGACHGASVGRGGFRLSLYGSNAAFDFRSIVRETQGRRVNLIHPEDSLLFRKPTESIQHGGGHRIDLDSEAAQVLLKWIREGSNRLPASRLVNLTIEPKSILLENVETEVSFSVVAEFEDGSQRDVTKWSVFTAEDPQAIQVLDSPGKVKAVRAGRNILTVRYLSQIQPVAVFVPVSDGEFNYEKPKNGNWVDDYVLEQLEKLRLPISPAVGDSEFIRRLSLDLTGRLPSGKTTLQFLSEKDKGKRARLIDVMLSSEEFTEYWTYRMSELLRIRSAPKDSQGAATYHAWLKQSIREQTPVNKMAIALLTASGDSHEVGPANFYRTVTGPREQTEFVTELFMGSRLRCANCHDHPLDRWKQDDYHGLAAIFAKVEQGRVIRDKSSGVVTHPGTGLDAVVKIPGEPQSPNQNLDRTEFAKWLTGPENPFFAKSIVNRLWQSMMGRGLVEPVDDFRSTNPATHPELLDALAKDFVQNGFRIRHTLRLIANSSAYARSTKSVSVNSSDSQFYSRAIRRTMRPEVFLDAVSDVCGIPESFDDESLARAIQLYDGKMTSESLQVLGRCDRQESCNSSTQAVGDLPRMLHVMNGSILNRRIGDPQGHLHKLLKQDVSPKKMVEDFYLLALSRKPTDKEERFWTDRIPKRKTEQAEFFEDFVWSLLSCEEFLNY